jgi:hypothetical protein
MIEILLIEGLSYDTRRLFNYLLTYHNTPNPGTNPFKKSTFTLINIKENPSVIHVEISIKFSLK